MNIDAETISQIAISVFSLVGTVVGIAHTYTSKKKFDLKKTVEAAGDVVNVVKALRKLGKGPGEAADIGVDMVEGLRGKKLGNTLRRKARAHIIDKAEDVLYANLEDDNPKIRQRAAEFALKNMPASTWKDNPEESNEAKLIEILNRMVDNTDPNK